jgi:hypothetical protein
VDSQIGRVVAGEVKKKNPRVPANFFAVAPAKTGQSSSKQRGCCGTGGGSLCFPSRTPNGGSHQMRLSTPAIFCPHARARARTLPLSLPSPSVTWRWVGRSHFAARGVGRFARVRVVRSAQPAVRRSPRTAAVAGGGGDLLMGGANPAAASCAATSESDHGGSERARCWPGLPFLRATTTITPLSLSLSSAVGPPRRRRADETVHPARPAGAAVFFYQVSQICLFSFKIVSMKNNKKE